MGLLNDNIKSQVQQALSGLQEPVHLVVFTQGEGGAIECTMCSETRQLAEEVAELSDKINLTVYDFVKDAEVAEQYGVDKIPALVIARGGQNPKDYGVRFFGIPSGYEFSSLIEDIRLVSQGQAGLSPKTLLDLEKIKEPVHIQVFVTPTWPYCPQAVVLAHKLAMQSNLITADMVEATEFPHLANKYQVYGVPRIVINEVIHIEGAVPEDHMLNELLQVTDPKKMEKLKERWEKYS